jgi:opacity protein-like surface antigen
MKKLLISTLLAVGLVSPALAKDMANHSAPAASSPAPVASWFGHVEGGYVFPASSHTKELGAPFTGFDDAHMGNGGYGSAKLGYHINDLWDIAVGFKYLEQSSGRINDDGYNWQATSGRYWNLDFEVGRRIEAAGCLLRPFGGLRYQEYDADFRDHLGVTFSARETSWGLGPRIGIDVFGISAVILASLGPLTLRCFLAGSRPIKITARQLGPPIVGRFSRQV